MARKPQPPNPKMLREVKRILKKVNPKEAFLCSDIEEFNSYTKRPKNSVVTAKLNKTTIHFIKHGEFQPDRPYFVMIDDSSKTVEFPETEYAPYKRGVPELKDCLEFLVKHLSKLGKSR